MLSQIGPQLWFLQNKIPQKALDSDLGACYVLPSRCECPDIERIRKAQGIELCVATHQTTQVLRFRPWRNSCFSSMATQTNLQVGINRWSWLGYKSGHVFFFFFFACLDGLFFSKSIPGFFPPSKKKVNVVWEVIFLDHIFFLFNKSTIKTKNTTKSGSYCWWLKSGWPVEVGSLSHYLQGSLYIPGGCLGFLNHQQ